MFIKIWHLHLRSVFPVILAVKVLDSQSRVPDSNLLGGFKIKVISAFHPVEVIQMSTRNSLGMGGKKWTFSLTKPSWIFMM